MFCQEEAAAINVLIAAKQKVPKARNRIDWWHLPYSDANKCWKVVDALHGNCGRMKHKADSVPLLVWNLAREMILNLKKQKYKKHPVFDFKVL